MHCPNATLGAIGPASLIGVGHARRPRPFARMGLLPIPPAMNSIAMTRLAECCCGSAQLDVDRAATAVQRVSFYFRRSFFSRRLTLLATDVLSAIGIAIVGTDFVLGRGRLRTESFVPSRTGLLTCAGVPAWWEISGRRIAAIS